MSLEWNSHGKNLGAGQSRLLGPAEFSTMFLQEHFCKAKWKAIQFLKPVKVPGGA
jgi:hypothetical protein